MASIDIHEGGKERSFKIEEDFVSIGREISCNVQIQDDSSSRKHCRIERDGLKYVVEDLQSRNGTYVNEVLLQGRRPLKDGDVIRIGQAKMIFHDSARPVEHTVALVTNPSFVRWSMILAVIAMLGGLAWGTIEVLGTLTKSGNGRGTPPSNVAAGKGGETAPAPANEPVDPK